jgi:hypothetical protein
MTQAMFTYAAEPALPRQRTQPHPPPAAAYLSLCVLLCPVPSLIFMDLVLNQCRHQYRKYNTDYTNTV